jgi:hypothetical protein
MDTESITALMMDAKTPRRRGAVSCGAATSPRSPVLQAIPLVRIRSALVGARLDLPFATLYNPNHSGRVDGLPADREEGHGLEAFTEQNR